MCDTQKTQEYDQVLCIGEKNENKRKAEEATRTGAQYGQSEGYGLKDLCSLNVVKKII